MSSFADELKELIDRWLDGGETTDDVIVALIDAIEELDPSDDD